MWCVWLLHQKAVNTMWQSRQVCAEHQYEQVSARAAADGRMQWGGGVKLWVQHDTARSVHRARLEQVRAMAACYRGYAAEWRLW